MHDEHRDHFGSGFANKIGVRPRGTGLSDRVDVSSLGDRVDDLRAVMDAVGSERAAIFGQSEGGVLALLFAALYPERTRALVLYGATARSLSGHDYPWGMDPALFEWAYSEIRQRWGEPVFLAQEAPSRLGDPAFASWWARYLEMGASPGAAVALLQSNARIDIRHLLPGIRTPTLVMQRRGDAFFNIGTGQYLADQIAGARSVLLEGEDHLPFVGDTRREMRHALAVGDQVMIGEIAPARRRTLRQVRRRREDAPSDLAHGDDPERRRVEGPNAQRQLGLAALEVDQGVGGQDCGRCSATAPGCCSAMRLRCRTDLSDAGDDPHQPPASATAVLRGSTQRALVVPGEPPGESPSPHIVRVGLTPNG